jgi:hypothetical protein
LRYHAGTTVGRRNAMLHLHRHFTAYSVVLALALGCFISPPDRTREAASNGLPSSQPASSPLRSAALMKSLAEAYPPGRWRLADPRLLSNVMLWFSHILIRHRDVPAALVAFNLPAWSGAPPAPDRSREDAFDMAQSVAERAYLMPESFGQLAREFSEDVATRDLGGAVGGVRADAIGRIEAVLDVMAALPVGAVSRVVETGYGFHIFKRHAPPARSSVSGVRIVIGHDDAPWLRRFLARRAIPHRSREEALAIAARVYRAARGNSAVFPSLVDQYSDHEDAVRDGDFGEWSTLEPTPFPRAVELLRRLDVGAVAPPIETLFGIEIIMRTPNHARARYAAARIEQRFDSSKLPSDPQSESSVLDRMRAIAADLTVHPSHFEQYQRESCCAVSKSWTAGRESALLEQALNGLGRGQIATTPTRLPFGYVIVKRLVPEETNGRDSIAFELPAPEHPDLEPLLRLHGTGMLREASAALAVELGVQGIERDRFLTLYASLAPSRNAQSLAGFDELQSELKDLLGTAYTDYRMRLDELVEANILRPRSLQSQLAVPVAAREL